MTDARQTTFQRIGRRLGVLYQQDGQPETTSGRGPSSKSRYDRGFLISRRLDEDIDDLRRRIADLERGLNADSN